MVKKAWKVIPRPVLETVLHNHAQHHRVPQPLILHGPRGVGKTTLVIERESLSFPFSIFHFFFPSDFLAFSCSGLLPEWNKGPHITGYVDLAQSIKDHHPDHNSSYPWSSWSNCRPPTLTNLRTQLEQCLESMAEKAVRRGTISSQQIFATMNKWHGLSTALRRIIESNKSSSNAVSDKLSSSVLWDRALFSLSARWNAAEIDGVLGLGNKGKAVSVEEATYFREAVVGLRLAKEVIKVQQGWRANAVAHLNRSGGYSRSLANSATDWPCLLLELLSQAAEIGFFQVINLNFIWQFVRTRMLNLVNAASFFCSVHILS